VKTKCEHIKIFGSPASSDSKIVEPVGSEQMDYSHSEKRAGFIKTVLTNLAGQIGEMRRQYVAHQPQFDPCLE